MPKAILIGLLTAFVNIIKTEFGLAAVLIPLFLLQEVVYYLVKWCSLPYEDSTWELKDDVDLNKIEEFEQLQAVKPDSRRMVNFIFIFSSVVL